MDDAPHDERWRAWLEEQAGRLLLFARQQTRSQADAEDVLQESVVESWRRHGGREPPPLPLVFATIRRRAIDLARREDRRRGREAASMPSDLVWFDPAPAEADALEAAMKNLSPLYREALTLKIWGGLTFEEIGSVLGIPANTAASRYRYGLEGMRRQLEGGAP